MSRYKRKKNKFFTDKIKNFKDHSNNVKDNLYNKYKGNTIMEFGAGLLNDLLRWKNNGIKKIYAIEVDSYSIEIGERRYKYLSKKYTLPEVIYIKADLTKDKIYENERKNR